MGPCEVLQQGLSCSLEAPPISVRNISVLGPLGQWCVCVTKAPDYLRFQSLSGMLYVQSSKLYPSGKLSCGAISSWCLALPGGSALPDILLGIFSTKWALCSPKL